MHQFVRTVYHRHICFRLPTAQRRHLFLLKFFNSWRVGVLHILLTKVNEGIANETRATEEHAVAALRVRLGIEAEDVTLANFRTRRQEARARQVGLYEGYEGHEAGTLALDEGDEGLHGYEAAIVAQPQPRPKAPPWGTWV